MGLLVEVGSFVAIFAAAELVRHEVAGEIGLPFVQQFVSEFLVFGSVSRCFGGIVLGGPTLLGMAHADGAVFVAAEAGEHGEELLEALPAFFRVGVLVEQRPDNAGEFEGEHGAEPVADGAVSGFFAGAGKGVGEPADEVGVFLLAKPVLEAALTPDAEVLPGNGGAVEEHVEDFLGLRFSVEPGEDGGGRLGDVEAAVEGVAEVAGEAGDFTGAGGGGHRILGFTIDD